MLTFEISQYVKSQVESFIRKSLPNEVKEQVKEELAKTRKVGKVNPGNDQFQMLKRGAINMKRNSAISSDEVYGKTILKDVAGGLDNSGLYDRMKNKINYGSNPTRVSINKGKYNFK